MSFPHSQHGPIKDQSPRFLSVISTSDSGLLCDNSKGQSGELPVFPLIHLILASQHSHLVYLMTLVNVKFSFHDMSAQRPV